MSESSSDGRPEPFTVQVTVDCADPHGLAEWWAETLRWEVEPQDEDFIRSMIEQGHAAQSDTIRHRGALVWRDGAAIRPNGEPSGGQPRILFQLVPEPKTVKNRVHLDLRPTGLDPEVIRAELIRRGASVVGVGRQGPHEWVTLTDPEGNEFCV